MRRLLSKIISMLLAPWFLSWSHFTPSFSKYVQETAHSHFNKKSMNQFNQKEQSMVEWKINTCKKPPWVSSITKPSDTSTSGFEQIKKSFKEKRPFPWASTCDCGYQIQNTYILLICYTLQDTNTYIIQYQHKDKDTWKASNTKYYNNRENSERSISNKIRICKHVSPTKHNLE